MDELMIESLTSMQSLALTAASLIVLLLVHIVLRQFEGPAQTRCPYCDTHLDSEIETCDICGSDLRRARSQ